MSFCFMQGIVTNHRVRADLFAQEQVLKKNLKIKNYFKNIFLKKMVIGCFLLIIIRL